MSEKKQMVDWHAPLKPKWRKGRLSVSQYIDEDAALTFRKHVAAKRERLAWVVLGNAIREYCKRHK